MKRNYPQPAWKKLLLAASLLIFQNKAWSQATTVYADPAVSSFDITTQGGVSVNANNLLANAVYKLKLVILNNDQITSLPDGTCYIKIGLGSKLIVDPTFDLSTAPYSNYFTWSTITSGGQMQIYGVIHAPVPADFIGELAFNIKSSTSAPSGTSTITANFLISNDNPLYFLSDTNPANNTASLQYSFTSLIPVPVTITKFSAVNKNCSLTVNWSTAQELNVSRYEVEASKDGINFIKISSVNAQNQSDYSSAVTLTDQLKAPVLYLRLKCIDIDGTFKYSSVVVVSGMCGTRSVPDVYGYPNPLTRGSSFISIGARNGLFNGSYELRLTDISGKVFSSKTVVISNSLSFRFDLPQALSPGKYFITLQSKESGDKAVVQFEKL